MTDDEYTRQLRRQNQGYVCERCGSARGHHFLCPLMQINSNPYFRPEHYKAQQLAPYPHELNSSGTGCSVYCPACTWVDAQDKREVELVLTPKDRELLTEMKIKV